MKRLVIGFLVLLMLSCNVYAQDKFDIASVMEKQRLELTQKEEILKKETERLRTIKREVEEGIIKYSEILKQIDKSLIKAEEIGNKRLKHVAKAYEAMQPEDAASRLTGLEASIAVQILLKMNSKKAGLVIGMMDTTRATLLTKDLTKIKK
jgi:flagellar motility protein MotE (MotC chaperone)